MSFLYNPANFFSSKISNLCSPTSTRDTYDCVRFSFLATSTCRKPASSRAFRSLPTKSPYSFVLIVSTIDNTGVYAGLQYLNSAYGDRLIWGVEAAPRLCRPFNFKKSPPRKKIRMERSGKARGRDARYSARGGIQHWHSIGAYDAVSSHHARGACEVGSRMG